MDNDRGIPKDVQEEIKKMFSFLVARYDYDDRVIDRYEKDGIVVSTVKIYDSEYQFETAVQHPLYRNGNFIIVANYNTKEEAQIGHDKWVGAITSEDLPEILEDVSAAKLIKFLESVSGINKNWRKHKCKD